MQLSQGGRKESLSNLNFVSIQESSLPFSISTSKRTFQREGSCPKLSHHDRFMKYPNFGLSFPKKWFKFGLHPFQSDLPIFQVHVERLNATNRRNCFHVRVVIQSNLDCRDKPGNGLIRQIF